MNRTKRGLINTVGEIQKLLWGNLAQSDLNDINTAIDEQTYKLNETINLVKNSTYINKQIIKHINTNFETYNENINLIKNWTQKTDSVIEKLKYNERINECLFELDLAIEDYKKSIDLYINSILNTQYGKISPYLIAPKTLITAVTGAVTL